MQIKTSLPLSLNIKETQKQNGASRKGKHQVSQSLVSWEEHELRSRPTGLSLINLKKSVKATYTQIRTGNTS